ncbi:MULTISPECIES: UvrD-helicase domain-containing protein [Candidatus Ichthyocystis]|uniref:UvrD-helicase domain-containing protein n=1 Tax=Candidatus Ichthyocystis TaxID=2929841 RepID=UPI000B27DDC2|nr:MULTISPECIES: UvrD-helicase domain-containing protein [Ichthyocystis]
MTHFIWSIPLNGRCLIEASAGTGKTWSIVSLYLRLAIEEPCDVKSILVVTYTRSAVAELRQRIRQRLTFLLYSLSHHKEELLPDYEWLSKLLLKRSRSDLILSVKCALYDFDQSPIYTIHGFCQRILREMNFDSGWLLDQNVISDSSDVYEFAVIQTMRMFFNPTYWPTKHDDYSLCAFRKFLNEYPNPKKIINFMKPWVFREDVVWELPIIPKISLSDLLVDIKINRKNVLSILNIDTITDLQSKICRGSFSARYYTDTKISNLLDVLRNSMLSNDIFEWKDDFDLLTYPTLEKHLKKSFRMVSHPLLDVISKLKCSYSFLHDWFRYDSARFWHLLTQKVQQFLDEEKKHRRVVFYDDLLRSFHNLLSSKDNVALYVAQQFPYILIDECQDTDFLQQNIFRKVFCLPNQFIAYVGDPKQAIYGFRGADIDAYLDIISDIDVKRYTLTDNYRSVPDLLSGISYLFFNKKDPFIFKGIEYYPVFSKKKSSLLQDNPDPPIQISFLPSLLTKTQALIWSANNVAQKILSLLLRAQRGELKWVNREISPGDVVVLVHSHYQADLVQNALRERRIPTTKAHQASVFVSEEAQWIILFLWALYDPQDATKYRALMMTPLIGLSVDELNYKSDLYKNFSQKFPLEVEKLHYYGLASVFYQFCDTYGVMLRLMKIDNGRRHIVNLFHLIDILQSDWLRCRDLLTLIHEIDKRRDDAHRGYVLDDYRLRLDYVDNAVLIVTQHASKGLEYPFVFCPFSWSVPSIASPYPIITRERGGYYCDWGSSKYNERVHTYEREILAEQVRLLYVSLTRACEGVYLVLGNYKSRYPREQLFNAMNWLLMSCDKDYSDWLSQSKLVYSDDCWQKWCDDCIGVSISSECDLATESYFYVPNSGVLPCNVDLSNRKLIDEVWHCSSFSKLWKGSSHHFLYGAAQLPAEKSLFSPWDSFKIVPGSRFLGSMVHRVLEVINYTDSLLWNDQLLHIQDEYKEYSNFHPYIVDIILRHLPNWLSTALFPLDISLSSINANNRFHELDFLYSWNPGCVYDAVSLLRDHDWPVPSISDDWPSGFLRGVIDVVFEHDGKFYIIDWKTNDLGVGVDDYSYDSLEKVMLNEGYGLQAMLYVWSINLWLHKKLPNYSYDVNFGGVFYIFLRGFGEKLGSGIWFKRPSNDLIMAWKEFVSSGKTR